MKYVRYDRRSRLTSANLDHLLRIRINGPPLEKFDVTPYTSDWLLKHLHTDDATGVRRRKNEEEERKYLERSNLF